MGSRRRKSRIWRRKRKWRRRERRRRIMRMSRRRRTMTTTTRRYRRGNLKYDMTPLLQEIFSGESTSQSDFVCLFVLKRFPKI